MARSHLKQKRFYLFLLALLVAASIGVDVYYAAPKAEVRGKFAPLSAFRPSAPAAKTRVALVRSDDPALPQPVSLSRAPSYAQIEAMTRRAIELAGGFGSLIRPGDKVLLKPCIVTNQATRNTDIRVVKAVARLVHEAAGGQVKILIAEGSAFATAEEMEYVYRYDEYPALGVKPGEPVWKKLWDTAGYQDLLADPELAGIDLQLVNLNGPWEELVQVEIPGGGYADPNGGKAWVHRQILDADVHITIPALKLHSYTGITVALKNNIGLYPSTKYGFPKWVGIPQDGFKTKLAHQSDLPRDWVEEEIVDMALVAGIDFAVVDALNCNYHRDRRNAILAGRDIVAVDHVAARLMGMNPDDIGHLTLAALAGLGTNDPAQIEIVGAPIDSSWHPFRKDNYFSLDFGQSNRIWLLRGPFATEGIDDPLGYPFIPDEGETRPCPGEEAWSEPIYFFDDRLDLGAYFGIGSGQPAAAYAFTYFEVPQAQPAELWVGSDEAMRIYLNGEVVYDYRGRRTYDSRSLVLDKVPVALLAGENALLVKVLQQSNNFDFALNICAPEADPALDGNRVSGLRFRPWPEVYTAVREEDQSVLPQGFELGQNYPNPFNANTIIPYRLPPSDSLVPTRLAIYNMRGQLVRLLVDRPMAPGQYYKFWDGRDEDGLPVASGVYLYRLETGTTAEGRKLLLLR